MGRLGGAATPFVSHAALLGRLGDVLEELHSLEVAISRLPLAVRMPLWHTSRFEKTESVFGLSVLLQGASRLISCSFYRSFVLSCWAVPSAARPVSRFKRDKHN